MRSFERLAVNIGIGVGHSIQRFFQAERPQHGEADANGRAGLAELQGRERIAVDPSFAGKVYHRPAATNPRDADALA